MIILRTCAESRAQRSFRNLFRDRDHEFEKSTSETRDEWHIRLSFTLDYSNFISWNRLPREKRAYPTRDCDNLPGPTYLQLTGTQEVYYLSYLALYLKNGKTGIPTHSFNDSHA